jgi:hypothetical protein
MKYERKLFMMQGKERLRGSRLWLNYARKSAKEKTKDINETVGGWRAAKQ